MELLHQLAYRFQSIRDDPQAADFSVAPPFGYRHRYRLGMDIQANVQCLLYGPTPLTFAALRRFWFFLSAHYTSLRSDTTAVQIRPERDWGPA
jgi:hypothetical protein